jgi:uncharacterized Fe-S cluster-containing radical SAM superfamily protein
MYNPREQAVNIEKIVAKGPVRKYYRLIRKDRWYGGVCTSDCVGCNLRCVFCWSDQPRNNIEKIGVFYTPDEIAGALTTSAKKYKIQKLRISGNEPTISREHLLRVLWFIETTSYDFILETNGTLIDLDYAKELARFRNLQVRVSLKGASEEEFSRLTGADPQCFQQQLDALENLLKAGVRFTPAVMLSFSPPDAIKKMKKNLKSISPVLLDNFEEEYVFLYPHVVRRLNAAGIKPLVSYNLGGIPKDLI